MNAYENVEDLLLSLADTTRLAILDFLRGGPKNAGEIIKALGKNPSTISQHLKKLTDSQILTYKTEGTNKVFQIKEMQVFDILNGCNSFINLTNAYSPHLEEAKKVLFLGLDKSGKTSILLSIFGQKNLMSYYSLSPTKGYKHFNETLMKLNLQAPTVDTVYYEAGGQVVYREEYLKNPQKYLAGYDKVVYVMDVRDQDRYEESLTYLQQILEELKKIYTTFNVAVYFHKFDPELEFDSKFSFETLNQVLIEKIRALMPPRFSYQILKSTIFTIFRRTSLILYQQSGF
jgi:DNA-binding transcriptional ArsR family regulator